MAGAAVTLIVGALIAWWIVDQAKAQPVGGEAGERPVLFLGNESLPPMNYVKQGKPTGIVVDLAKALTERMHRPVEIRLMNWAEAQQLVLEGRADALLQINPDPERLKIYDFSEPLLTSEFTIFTSAERLGVTSMSDLRGLKVGVEEKGLPILLLQKDPRIIVKIIPDFVQGFTMLATGALDAVVADRWVGSYVLAENNIRGVKLIEGPLGRSESAIAVKKGNTSLLGNIDAALTDIRRDGTYDRIINSWRSKEVVFKTREQLRQQALLIAAISVGLIVTLVGIVVLAREVRRRKRVEATLRESEGRLRLFIEHAPASLAMFDLEMRYLSASHRWVSDYNLGDRDLSGVSHYEVFPEIPDYWKEVHRRGLAGEVIRADADRFERADGSVQWLRWEVRPWYDAGGDVGGIVIFTEDITERKRAEEALRGKEATLSGILDAAKESIWLLSPDGFVVTANETALLLHGKSVGEVIGKHYTETLRTELAHSRLEHLRAVVESGRPVEFEDQRDGIFFHHSLYPVLDAEERVTSVVCFSRDITERKRMEEELRQSHAELELKVQERTAELRINNRALMDYAAKLERLNRELEEFAFVASHDLQEPLRKIQTFGCLLMKNHKENLDEPAQAHLLRITGSAKRMSDSLHSLLNYSQIASEPCRCEIVDLKTVARAIAGEFEFAFSQAGGKIEIGNLPEVEADSRQIRNLLQSLIDNSIKYCKDGQSPLVKIHGEESGGTCSIFVEDNGIGFDERYLDLIFKPFQQLHGRGKYEGTGMGLALCRKIVERHEGSITARSIPGQGSTFIVRLPSTQRKR